MRVAALALALASSLGLAACQQTTGKPLTLPTLPPNTYAALVATIQADYPKLTAAAALYASSPAASPGIVAEIQQAEAIVGPQVAALSPSSPPNLIAAALRQLTPLLAVPELGISTQTRGEINTALGILGILATTA